MARLLYSATMSLDGFIAGPGGDMAWLRDHLGPNPVAEQLVADVGALLVGGRTFRGDDPNAGTDQEGAFEGAWTGPQVVLTRTAPDDPPPGVVFVDDLERAVETARSLAADRYVNVLGARTAASCLAAGLLDEVLVLVAPVLLGDGVRLFDHPGGTDVRLERLHVSTAPSAVNLWWRVVR